MAPTRRTLLKSIAAGTVLAVIPTVAIANPAPRPATPGEVLGMYVQGFGDREQMRICYIREMSDGSLAIEKADPDDPMPGLRTTIPNLSVVDLTALVNTVHGGAA